MSGAASAGAGAAFGPPAASAGSAFGSPAAFYGSPDQYDHGFNYGSSTAHPVPGTLKDIRDNLQPTPLAIDYADQEYAVDSSANEIDDVNIQRMLAVYQTFGKYLFNASAFYSSSKSSRGLFSKSVYIHTRRGFKNKYDVILTTDTLKTTPDRRTNIKLLEAFRAENNIADNPDPTKKLDNIKILNFNCNPLDFVAINKNIRDSGVTGKIDSKKNFELFLEWLLRSGSNVTASGPGPNQEIYYRSDIIAMTEGYVGWYHDNDAAKYFYVSDSDGNQCIVYISNVVYTGLGKYKYILFPEKPNRRQKKIMCFAISRNLREKINEPDVEVVPIKIVSAGPAHESYALGVVIGTTIYVVVHPQQADKTHRINYYRCISKCINELNLKRLHNGELLIVNIILVGDFNCLTTVIHKGTPNERNIGVYKEMLLILKEFPLFEGNWTNFNTPTITSKNGINVNDGKPYDSLVILTMKKPQTTMKQPQTTFLGIELGTIEIGNKQKYAGDPGYVRTVFEAGDILAPPKNNASYHRPIITLVPMSVILKYDGIVYDNIETLIDEQISTQDLIELEGDGVRRITRKRTKEIAKELTEEEIDEAIEKMKRAKKLKKTTSKNPDVGDNPDDSPDDSSGDSPDDSSGDSPDDSSGDSPSAGASASASAGPGGANASSKSKKPKSSYSGTGKNPKVIEISDSDDDLTGEGPNKFGGKNKKTAKGSSNPRGSSNFEGKNKKTKDENELPTKKPNKKTKDENELPTKKPNKKTKDENVISILTKQMKKILKI